MKIKIAFTAITLMFSAMFTVNVSANIIKEPAPQSFTEMYNYWNQEKVHLNNILDMSASQILATGNKNFIITALFVQKSVSKVPAKQIEASESLSSFCYDYINKNSEIPDHTLSKCLDGTMIPEAMNLINEFYQYAASKKFWEKTAKDCMNYNYARPNGIINGTKGRGIALTDSCATQLSLEAFSNKKLAVQDSSYKIATGEDTGVKLNAGTVKMKDIVVTGANRNVYGSFWGSDRNQIKPNCSSGYAPIGVNHIRSYKNSSRTRKHEKTFYCVSNPHGEIYPKFTAGCGQAEKFIKSEGIEAWDEMCGNWSLSGLSNSANFYDAVKATLIPNKSYYGAGASSDQYGYDHRNAKKAADLKKYWSEKVSCQTSKFGDCIPNTSKSNVDKLSYGFVPTAYPGHKRFPGNFLGFKNTATGAYTPVELNSARMGTINNKVSVVVENRSDFGGTSFFFYGKNNPTAQSRLPNMSLDYVYPTLSVDTKVGVTKYQFYNKVYNFHDKAANWLHNENNWNETGSFSCYKSAVQVFDNADVIEGTPIYDLTKSEAAKISAYEPRAVRIKINSGQSAIKPFSKMQDKPFTVCSAF